MFIERNIKIKYVKQHIKLGVIWIYNIFMMIFYYLRGEKFEQDSF